MGCVEPPLAHSLSEVTTSGFYFFLLFLLRVKHHQGGEKKKASGAHANSTCSVHTESCSSIFDTDSIFDTAAIQTKNLIDTDAIVTYNVCIDGPSVSTDRLYRQLNRTICAHVRVVRVHGVTSSTRLITRTTPRSNAYA